jgi:hypothetical protein
MAPRKGRQYWFALIEEQLASGLSQKDFAEARRINVGSFRQWVYRYRDEHGSAQNAMRLVEIAPAKAVTLPVTGGEEACRVRLVVGRHLSLDFEGLPAAGYLVDIVVGLRDQAW